MKFLDSNSLPTYDDWLGAAKSVVKGDLFDEILFADLGSGILTDPIYIQQEDNVKLDYPTDGISRRASNISGLTDGWDIRQRHWVTSYQKTNEEILNDLQRGATSVEIVSSKITSADFDSLLDQVHLGIAGLSLTSSSGSLNNARNFINYLDSKDSESSEFIFDLGFDPISELFRNCLSKDSALSGLDDGGILAKRVHKDFGRATTYRIDGLEYAEAGADPVTELATIASILISYLHSMDKAGVPLSNAFSQIHIVVSVGTDQFFDIAKIRALRVLISRIGEVCNVRDVHLKIQASIPQFLISKTDPWVNLLRTTVGCFSAAIGGADIICLPPFDSAFGVPDDFGMRLARNTQLVLMEESNIHRVIDPAGGSWYVESLTDEIAQKAWEKFQSFELNGGIIQAISSGSFQESLKESREKFKEQIETNEKTFIGVNDFHESAQTELVREPYPNTDTPKDGLVSQRLSQFRISDLATNKGAVDGNS